MSAWKVYVSLIKTLESEALENTTYIERRTSPSPFITVSKNSLIS